MNPDEGNSLVRNERHKKKDIQQFKGVVPVKKKEKTGFIKWTCDMFFSGKTLREILKDLYEHQIVPEMKTTIRNAIVGVIDQKLGDSAPTNYVQTSSGFITRMVDYATASISKQPSLPAAETKDIPKMSGYELPSFPTYDKAMAFLNSMKNEVKQHGDFSIHDMAWKQGKTVDWTYESWGWTMEMILSINKPKRLNPPIKVQVRDTDGKIKTVIHNWYIDMPPTVQLQ